MYRLALDLEFNKENEMTTDIIQVGAIIGHIYTGNIKEKLSYLIKIDKPLSEEIIKLTGITENSLKSLGTNLESTYSELEYYMSKYECSRSILTWGKGDQEALKKQSNKENVKSKIGNRYTDVKTLYCEYMLSNNKSMKAGLAGACYNMGMQFIGQPHNAVWDAYNTFTIYRKLLTKMRD